MSSQNVPCYSSKLCGVQSHRPGTDALCQKRSGNNPDTLARKINGNPSRLSEKQKAQRMWSDPDFNFTGTESHPYGALTLNDGPMINASRSNGIVSMKYLDKVLNFEAEDYLSEDDLKDAVKEGYRELTAHLKERDRSGDEPSWQGNRELHHRQLKQRSAESTIGANEARSMAGQSIRGENATSGNKGMTDAIILNNLAANRSVPQDVLEQIAEAPLAEKRYTEDLTELVAAQMNAKLRVAENPNASDHALRVLSIAQGAGSDKVRETAKDKMKARGIKPPGLRELMRGFISR